MARLPEALAAAPGACGVPAGADVLGGTGGKGKGLSWRGVCVWFVVGWWGHGPLCFPLQPGRGVRREWSTRVCGLWPVRGLVPGRWQALPIPERLREARRLKDEGNSHFKHRRLTEALTAYEHSLGLFRFVQHKDPDWRKARKPIRDDEVSVQDVVGNSGEEVTEVRALKLKCLLNISTVGIQVGGLVLSTPPPRTHTPTRTHSVLQLASLD
jgi:hypothetical protein